MKETMLLLLNRVILVVFISLFSFSTSSEEAKSEFGAELQDIDTKRQRLVNEQQEPEAKGSLLTELSSGPDIQVVSIIDQG